MRETTTKDRSMATGPYPVSITKLNAVPIRVEGSWNPEGCPMIFFPPLRITRIDWVIAA